MKNKVWSFPSRPLHLLSLFVFMLFSAGILAGCNILRRETKNTDSDKDIPVPMSAAGKFESMANFNPLCKDTANEITIRWETQPNNEILTFTGGEGKRYTDCNGTYTNLDLVFENGSIDGDKYSGTVHAKGPGNPNVNVIEIFEFDANWTAIRKGDYIEGMVDGIGGFILKVNPAPEGWRADD